VLRRLTQKGWLSCEKQGRAFSWKPLVSRQEAQVLEAHNQLNRFLAVGNPDVVAAFADSLDAASLEQIEAIALRLQSARSSRQEEK
jgi:predicted transcriptional regulator